MKFTATAIVAFLAASANGFSVSMSSIGYLDNLSKGSGLSSFSSYSAPAPAPASYAPTPSYAPAPASYSYGSAPAPAPASSYQSSFANLPVNKDVDYMKSLNKGSAMKDGPNYTGMSRSFRPSQGFAQATYLDALTGTSSRGYSSPQGWGAPAAPAPAPMPYSAPSYSAPSNSAPSYSAPSNSAPSYSSAPPGASSGSAMKSGRNYTGMNKKFQPTQQGFAQASYLEGLKGKSMASDSFSSGGNSVPQGWGAPAAPAPAPVSYGSPSSSGPSYSSAPPSLSSGSAMKNGRNYTGMNQKFQPTSGFSQSTYLDGLKGKTMAPPSYNSNSQSAPQGWGAPAAAAPTPYSAPSYSSSPPAPASYGGGAASNKPASYSGFNSKPAAAVRSPFGNYLATL